jgi:hypothetical protein
MKWLAIDPGETTGWSLWDDKKLVDADQMSMWKFADSIYDAVAVPGDIQYLAGLLDGEGHIAIQNKEHSCGRIQINMTNAAPLEWCATTFGGNFNGPYDKGKGKKKVYTWSTAQADTVVRILSQVRPHLKVKGEDADGVLDFLDEKGVEPSPFVGISAMVIEQWQLYPWELQNLAWDQCRTARLIGALTLICRQFGIKLVFQGADIKEGAIQAGAEALFIEPVHENRHANDATMHGVFYLAKNGKAPV